MWDFTVRYMMKVLRLSEKEMLGFDKFLADFVGPGTEYRPRRGKVMVWASASLYFYSQLKLVERQPFPITLERISEIFDLTCQKKLSDFKKVIDSLKQAHS